MVSIFIPTQNRPSYLKRALEFYKRMACGYRIMVADSSDLDRKAAVAAAVRGAGLKVDLLSYEHGTPLHEKISDGLTNISSPFMVFAGDDDFIFPEAIGRCASFLDTHQEYSVSHGQAFTFTVLNSAARGPLTGIRRYPQRESVLATSGQRLKQLFEKWSTSFYSVQRTHDVRETFSNFNRLGHDVISCEVYYYARNAIRGKTAKHDINYMFRQREVQREAKIDDIHVWARQPGWDDIRNSLVREIALELARAGGGSMEECFRFVDTLVKGWVEAARPFELRRWASYNARYFWERAGNVRYKLGLRSLQFVKGSKESAIIGSVVENVNGS